MQTILGANGVIGRALSRALYSYEKRIRQVSRAPRRMHPTDDLVSADLLDAKATADAVAGSSVGYLVAGLKYDARVRQEQWPTVMRNAIMEMLYQFEHDYRFDSGKFERAFGLTATGYREGIAATLRGSVPDA